ncbi:MAG: hypothetical protein AB7F09_04400 [Parvibaculaceae bacterium]
MSVWQEFNGGDNEASVVTADSGFEVSDAPDETVGDISLGFSVAAPEGWSGFVRGSYQLPMTMMPSPAIWVSDTAGEDCRPGVSDDNRVADQVRRISEG